MISSLTRFYELNFASFLMKRSFSYFATKPFIFKLFRFLKKHSIDFLVKFYLALINFLLLFTGILLIMSLTY